MAEFIGYSFSTFFGFTLMFVRIAGLCVVAPFFGGEQVPRFIRVLVALGVALLMFPALGQPRIPVPDSLVAFVLILVREVCIGMLIGFLVTAIFYGFQMGGQFISIHMGISMARMLDPLTNIEGTPIGQLFGLSLIVIFLIMNGHHLILKTVYDSFQSVPLGQAVFSQGVFTFCLEMFNIALVTSLKIAAPVMAALFALNLVFGFMARLVPQVNVFILALPVQIAVGCIIIIVMYPAMIVLFAQVCDTVFQDVITLVRAL